MKKTDRTGPICILAASVCWSFGGLLIKYIPWHAMAIVGLRALLAACVFIVFRRSVKISFTKGNMITAASLSLTTIMFVFANKLTTSAAAILLQFTSPIFIILIHLIFYKTKPKPREAVVVSLTICGMLLFFTGQLDGGSMLGNVLAIGSGVFFAGVCVGNRMEDTKPEQAIFMGFILNAVVGAPFAFFSATADPIAWGAIFILGAVQVGLAYVFFSIGIKRTPALLACLIAALEPVLNPLWVALVTGEIPGPMSMAGGVVIILSIVGYNVFLELYPAKPKETNPA